MHFLLTILCILTFATLAEAAEATEPVSQSMVVTAGRINEKQNTIPQSVTIIDNDILERNQYDNLADLLQNYGLGISSYGPSQTSGTVSIRGFSTALSDPLDSNVAVLVNGAPIATVNLAMIPADGIERIEILRGAAAVQYGSSAIGGVINIIPKKGGDKFQLSAEAGGGTWNAMRALGNLSGSLDKMDFAGSVSWNSQQNNYTTGNGKLYQDTQARGRLAYLLNMGFNFNEENRIGAILLGANDWGLGLNQSLTDEKRYNGLDFSAKRVNSSFNASYDGGYSRAGLNWKLRYYNAYDQYENKYPADNPMFMSDNTIEATQQGAQGQASWTWELLTLTAGLDHSHNEYASGYAPTYEQDDTGLFAMLKLNFFDEMIVLSGGLRHDFYKFSVRNNNENLQNTAFSAGIAINPFDWLTLKANFAESFKVPSGLYIVGYDGPYGVEGNSALDPEKGYGWDTGINIHYKGLTLGLTYFSTEYANKFLSQTLPSGKNRYYNSNEITWFNGFEGEASIDLGEFFDWEFTLKPYFYFTKLLNYTDGKTGKLYNTRDLTASWGINFNHPEIGLNADLRFNYLGYQKEMAFGDFYQRLPDKRTGGKTTMDFFISQEIYDFGDGGKLNLKGEIRNITNENYAYRYDYPMPGRSFYCGIRYDY